MVIIFYLKLLGIIFYLSYWVYIINTIAVLYVERKRFKYVVVS